MPWLYDQDMNSPGRGALWLARASAWTCAAYGLSVGAHVVGGGQAPTVRGAAFIAVALLWVGLILTRRRVGAVLLTATLTGSQVLLHGGLTLSERSAACATTDSSSGPHAGHGLALECPGSASGAAAVLTHAEHSALTMTAAHVLAAIALGLVLARSEDAVWFLAGLLLPTLPVAPVLPSLTRRPLVPTHGGERPPTVPLLGGVGRRGPPVLRAPVVA